MAEFKRKQGEKARKDGKSAEIKAAIFLSLKGYRILEKNFRPPRGSGAGEIDLIAIKSDVLVFVEVKLRKSKTDAAEAVSSVKDGSEGLYIFYLCIPNLKILKKDSTLF